jgi:D-alanyl-D-alanine carboxypeptidase
MKRYFNRTAAALLLAGCLVGLSACAGEEAAPANTKPAGETGAPSGSTGTNAGSGGGGASNQTPPKTGESGASSGSSSGTGTAPGSSSGASPGTSPGASSGASSGNAGKSNDGATGTGSKPAANDGKTVQVVAKPADIAVLVNKTNKLPDNFKPDDLVEPNIPFIFKEKSDKRLMRKEAAGALEKLVAAAKKDDISLAGVSGYRSQSTQKTLFENYAKKDGEEAARKYSAVPGHSEHQTGLAMDVSGSDGKCAASDCFAGTKEAKWLAEHAAEHGFIIRYPKGKEDITGYQYEPWHLRYVGTKAAKEIMEKGVTLEEYMSSAIPVSK